MEKEIESVELQMFLVCVRYCECVNIKVLVKTAQLGSDPVNVIDSVNEFNFVKLFENIFNSVNVSVGGIHSKLLFLWKRFNFQMFHFDMLQTS